MACDTSFCAACQYKGLSSPRSLDHHLPHADNSPIGTHSPAVPSEGRPVYSVVHHVSLRGPLTSVSPSTCSKLDSWSHHLLFKYASQSVSTCLLEAPTSTWSETYTSYLIPPSPSVMSPKYPTTPIQPLGSNVPAALYAYQELHSDYWMSSGASSLSWMLTEFELTFRSPHV